jgi:hypothetical protein
MACMSIVISIVVGIEEKELRVEEKNTDKQTVEIFENRFFKIF